MEPATTRHNLRDLLYQNLLWFHLFSTTARTEAVGIFKSQECFSLFHLDTVLLKTAAASPSCTYPQQSHRRISTAESNMHNKLLNTGHKTFPLFCTTSTCLHRCGTSLPETHLYRVNLSDARRVLGVHSFVLTKQSLQKTTCKEQGDDFLAKKYSLQSKMKPWFTSWHFRVFYNWI